MYSAVFQYNHICSVIKYIMINIKFTLVVSIFVSRTTQHICIHETVVQNIAAKTDKALNDFIIFHEE